MDVDVIVEDIMKCHASVKFYQTVAATESTRARKGEKKSSYKLDLPLTDHSAS